MMMSIKYLVSVMQIIILNNVKNYDDCNHQKLCYIGFESTSKAHFFGIHVFPLTEIDPMMKP